MNKKTHEQFIQDLLNKNEHYRDGKFKVIGEYECDRCKIMLETKYGKCLVIPNTLLIGVMPLISSAINKAEYFKNMCYDKFGESKSIRTGTRNISTYLLRSLAVCMNVFLR